MKNILLKSSEEALSSLTGKDVIIEEVSYKFPFSLNLQKVFVGKEIDYACIRLVLPSLLWGQVDLEVSLGDAKSFPGLCAEVILLDVLSNSSTSSKRKQEGYWGIHHALETGQKKGRVSGGFSYDSDKGLDVSALYQGIFFKGEVTGNFEEGVLDTHLECASLGLLSDGGVLNLSVKDGKWTGDSSLNFQLEEGGDSFRLLCSFSSEWSQELRVENFSLFSDTKRFEGEGSLFLPFASQGSFQIEKASFEDLQSGVSLVDVQANISLEEDRVLVESISASDSEGGLIRGSGEVSFREWERLEHSFSLELQKSSLIQHDYVSTLSDGHLTLKGDREQSYLSGKLLCKGAKLEIPDVKSFELPQLNRMDVYLDKKKPPSFWGTISLDVEMEVVDKVSIYGRGLHSKWLGKLHLKGNCEHAYLEGTLKMQSGVFLFSGKRFHLTSGICVFRRDEESANWLNIEGDLVFPDAVVRAALKGPLTNLRLQFDSMPSLDLSEIMARVLFNRRVSEITALEALQVAQVVMNLSEGKMDLDLLGKLKKNIGIDQLNVQNLGEEEASLTIGKTLSDGTAISFEKKVYGEDGSLGIEAQISKDFSIEADFSNSSENKMRLKWRHDY